MKRGEERAYWGFVPFQQKVTGPSDYTPIPVILHKIHEDSTGVKPPITQVFSGSDVGSPRTDITDTSYTSTNGRVPTYHVRVSGGYKLGYILMI